MNAGEREKIQIVQVEVRNLHTVVRIRAGL